MTIKVVELIKGFGVDKWIKMRGNRTDEEDLEGHIHLVTKFYPEGGDAYNSVIALMPKPQLGKRCQPSSEQKVKRPDERKRRRR